MKRGRGNCEEECCVPLSKRINNLCINNGSYCNGLSHAEHAVPHNSENNPDQWAAASTSSIAPNHHPTMSNNGQVNYAPQYATHDDSTHQHYAGGEAGNSAVIPPSWAVAGQSPCPPYNPDLSATDNPYYYNNNKLLYELYMERLQRGGLL